MKKLSVLLFVPFILSGCIGLGKSNFSCDGVPEGVSCLSAKEVYDLTANAENLTTLNSDDDESGALRIWGLQNLSPQAIAVRKANNNEPMPIRVPEQVMRIWVAPWEDKNKTLHMANMIYTEIEERKWSVGEKVPDSMPRLSPLQIINRNEKQTQGPKRKPN